MKIFKNKKNLIKHISQIKNLAFVPTMGTLHRGHISLIKEAKKKSKNILVTIFVNPKQFNSKRDFKKYPRNINKDIKILEKENIKFLYLPDNKDIYSFKPVTPIYLHKFSKELCGKFRPGHFKGVINVVNRFLINFLINFFLLLCKKLLILVAIFRSFRFNLKFLEDNAIPVFERKVLHGTTIVFILFLIMCI